MIIKDTNGNEINLLPFQVREGQESTPVNIRVYPGSITEKLEASLISEATVYGKIGAGAFQDLATNPLDVGLYFGGYVTVNIKVVASNSLSGIVRKIVFLGGKTGGAANWLV